MKTEAQEAFKRLSSTIRTGIEQAQHDPIDDIGIIMEALREVELVDVEVIKQECVAGILEGRSTDHKDVFYDIVSEAVNIMKHKGYFRAPLDKVEGLEDVMEQYRTGKRRIGCNNQFSVIFEAARKYLEASE